MNVYYHTDGMNYTEAQEMRKAGANVWGCWFCIHERRERRFWFETDLLQMDHVFACKKHWEQEAAKP